MIVGDDRVGVTIYRKFQKPVIVGVAAPNYPFGNRHQFGNGKHPSQIIKKERHNLGAMGSS
jgi:hypothetical protein